MSVTAPRIAVGRDDSPQFIAALAWAVGQAQADGDPSVRVSAAVRKGRPASVLVQAARDADLLVTRRHASYLLRGPYGRTARNVRIPR